MFEGLEYASYIALMRELRMGEGTRMCRMGDWYVDANDEPRCIGWHPERQAFVEGVLVWLPRLDQWLDMLEEAGVPDVGFWSGEGFGKCGILCPGDFDGISYADLETASTREEACARLWLATTGRTVEAHA